MQKWIRRHPLLAAGLAIGFGSAPQWLSGTWSLFSDEPLFVVLLRQKWIPHLSFSFLYITWPIAIALLLAIWWTVLRYGGLPVLTRKKLHELQERNQEALAAPPKAPSEEWSAYVAPGFKRENCLMLAARILKGATEGSLWSFNAICRAKVEQLDSNDDVVWVCDELEKREYDHPFFGLDNHVPKTDWKEFVREAKLRVTTDTTGEYVELAERWWEIKGYPQPTRPVDIRLKVRLNLLRRQGA